METTIAFQNQGETIFGALHVPATPNGIGIIFLHGWSGNRLGPHRMFVTLARRLETKGFHCLRIDFRGRGDSEGAMESASIQGMIGDAIRALDDLGARPGVKALYMLGICSGGKVAIGTASRDSRVRGLALWSAEAMGDLRATAAKTNKSLHALKTYLRKLGNPETWKKILTGRVNTRMVKKAIVTDEKPRDAEVEQEKAMLASFRKFKGPLQFIFGGNDPDTRFAAAAYEQFCRKHGISGEFHEIREANHSFYSLAWENEVLGLTERWFVDRAAGR